jgi:PA domain
LTGNLRDSAKSKQRALSGEDYSQAYRATIDEDGLRKHLEAFQQAADLSGGIRAAGSSGWVKSLQYVARQLTEAGYIVRYHEFLAPYYEELTPPELTILSSPMSITNTAPSNQKSTFFAYKGSASGVVQASVHSVAVACNSRDFDEMPAGSIALIQTGTECPPYDQLYNAFNYAGASAVILVNQGTQGNEDALRMPFHKPLPIPVLLGSSALGNA